MKKLKRFSLLIIAGQALSGCVGTANKNEGSNNFRAVDRGIILLLLNNFK